MSQSSFALANQSGAAYRAAVNGAFQALASRNYGVSAPTETYPLMYWADTSASPTVIIKQRNSSNSGWVSIGVMDGSGFRPYYNGAVLGDAATKTVGTSVGQIALLGTGGIFDASLLPTPTSTIPVGVVLDYFGASAPSGWYLCDGSTIGSASASADYSDDALEDLFLHVWANSDNTWNPVSGGRGASSAADWAANKTIALPDARGCATIALDNLGGIAASRVTASSTNGGNSTTNGARGGAQTATSQVPSHTHDVQLVTSSGGSSSGLLNVVASSSKQANGTVTTSSSGSGSTHSNTQPWIAFGKIIKA